MHILIEEYNTFGSIIYLVLNDLFFVSLRECSKKLYVIDLLFILFLQIIVNTFLYIYYISQATWHPSQ